MERSNPTTQVKRDKSLKHFASKYHLEDTQKVNGVFSLGEAYTFRHWNGDVVRLDYQLTTNLDKVVLHSTKSCARLGTNHRLVTVRYDIFGLLEAWKSELGNYEYPTPVHFDNSEVALGLFKEEEERWSKSFDPTIWQALLDNDSAYDALIIQEQQDILDKFSLLCVDVARKIWPKSTNNKFKHKRSKVEGIALGKLTWVVKAIEGMADLTKERHPPLKPHTSAQIKALRAKLEDSELADKGLVVRDWSTFQSFDVEQWFQAAKEKRSDLRKELREIEKEKRAKMADKHRDFLLNQGMINSSAFRRRRLLERRDPDGEAILSKEGVILVTAEDIVNRYGEYYRDLLGKETDVRVERREDIRDRWLNEDIISANKSKLVNATGSDSVVASVPCLEEVKEAIFKGMHRKCLLNATTFKGFWRVYTNKLSPIGKPSLTPGADGIQYGALQRVSEDTLKVLTGLIGVWWRNRFIPETLRYVELCSIHKRGDRLNLFNKRGVGLASKLILIMEAVLTSRMITALDKAGTRSKAQGGSTNGIQTLDTVATLINVISHAYRRNKPLHIMEFDLWKFFDTIPHRAFEDAHRFFGLSQDTIEMASLFWKNFSASARSIYGRSDTFKIVVGNIQGLVGSPFRSSMVLDMFLMSIERSDRGYLFTTDNFTGM